jgi:hypothetical protein
VTDELFGPEHCIAALMAAKRFSMRSTLDPVICFVARSRASPGRPDGTDCTIKSCSRPPAAWPKKKGPRGGA